ncbi:unnamed protein product, partial [Staurois parvus]
IVLCRGGLTIQALPKGPGSVGGPHEMSLVPFIGFFLVWART